MSAPADSSRAGADRRALTGSSSGGADERTGGGAENAPKPAPWPAGVSQELRAVTRRSGGRDRGDKIIFHNALDSNGETVRRMLPPAIQRSFSSCRPTCKNFASLLSPYCAIENAKAILLHLPQERMINRGHDLGADHRTCDLRAGGAQRPGENIRARDPPRTASA